MRPPAIPGTPREAARSSSRGARLQRRYTSDIVGASESVWVREWIVDGDVTETFDLSGWPDTASQLEISWRILMADEQSLGLLMINGDYEDTENDYFWRLVPHDPVGGFTTIDNDTPSVASGGGFGLLAAYGGTPQEWSTGTMFFPGVNAADPYEYPVGYHALGQTNDFDEYIPDAFSVAGFPQLTGPVERIVLFGQILDFSDEVRQPFKAGSRVIVKAFSPGTA